MQKLVCDHARLNSSVYLQMEYLICIAINYKVTIFLFFFRLLWHPLWQHWPVVRHSESSHRDVVTFGAKLQKRKEVCQEGGSEGQLSSRHETQFVPLHQQPAKEDPGSHSWQVQHTWGCTRHKEKKAPERGPCICNNMKNYHLQCWQ